VKCPVCGYSVRHQQIPEDESHCPCQVLVVPVDDSIDYFESFCNCPCHQRDLPNEKIKTQTSQQEAREK